MNIVLPDMFNELVERHEEFPSALVGIDAGEHVRTSILPDRIIVERFINDDAVCMQVWTADGVTEVIEDRFIA